MTSAAPSETVVVGAGPGGLAVAAELKGCGVPVVVVDQADTVAAAWHRHYDRLHLHTVRWLSGLPGMPIPRRYGPWVARDHVIDYLQTYAAHHDLDVQLGIRVSGWTARRPAGASRRRRGRCRPPPWSSLRATTTRRGYRAGQVLSRSPAS